jgi:hypothetical protein
VSTVAEKLNEILADELACVRVLRRSESQGNGPVKREVIKRIHKDCSVNCVSLANAVRSLGGRPTDIPSARFSLKLSDESLTDTLDMVQSAQQHIIDEIAAVMDEPDLKSARSSLSLVQQLHKENIRWLKSAMP